MPLESTNQVDSRDLLTIDEVSRIVGFPSRTVRRWIKAGHLRAIRHPKGWTVLRADLSTFIQGLPETSVITDRATKQVDLAILIAKKPVLSPSRRTRLNPPTT